MNKPKILIVEDEAVTAMALEENLLSNGYEISDIIDKGEDVISSIEKSSPDVILMDIILKGKMSGIDAAKKVTNKYDIPIVYLTANSDEVTFKNAKVTHPYGFILKPFNERELKINIEISLDKKQLENALNKLYNELEFKVEERTVELTKANTTLKKEVARRQIAEDKLRDSQQKWDSLVKNTNQMVAIIDLEDKIKFISDIPESAKQAGLSIEKMIGVSLYSFFGEGYHELITDSLERVINTKVTAAIQAQGSVSRNFYDCTILPSYKNEKIDGTIWLFTDITDKLVIQYKLKEREERYRNFITFSHEGIWRMEFSKSLPSNTAVTKMVHHILYDGVIKECNDAMAKMYGYNNAAEMHGKSLIDLFGAVTLEEGNVAIERTKTFIKNNYSITNSISSEKDKNGNNIYISNSTLGDIEKGKLIRIWGIQRDVTHQILTEKSLKESESRLAEAQRITHVGNWYWNVANNKLHWSDETFRLFGYEPNEVEISFDFFLQHIHEDDLETTKATIFDLLSNQSEFHQQYRIVTKTGEVKISEAQGEAIVDNDGNTIAMRGTCQDITRRIFDEQKLKLSEKRFRDVALISSDFVWEIGVNGKYTYCSGRVEEVFGYTMEEMFKMTPFDLMIAEDSISEREHFAELIKNPKDVKNHENWNIKKNGDRVCLLTNMVTILDDKGNFMGMRGVDQDITERKKTEQALHNAHEDLENKVKERTKELNSTNIELQELSYSLSHDLKAPLRGVKTLIDWIYEDNKSKIDEESLNNFQMVDRKIVMLYNLIENMVEYARIGSIAEKQESIDINKLVLEIVDMLKIDSSIKLNLLNKLPVINASKIQMTRIFQNLFSNAIKHNDNKEILIEVASKKTKSGWEFLVKDNGIGIETIHYDRIFKIFQTLQPKDNVSSTGIGLSIVKKIVGKYKGKIWVESEPGNGSCFYFTLTTN